MINNIACDTYILLRSIYHIHNRLFYSGHSSFVFFAIFTSIPTWEIFELNQCQSLNYFVYLVSLHQIKNY